MEIHDSETIDIDIELPENLSKLIVKYLCDREYNQILDGKDKESLSHFISNAKKIGMNFHQFNELMLLLNQDIVSEDFFDFFFGEDSISLNELKKGVEKFRGFAMLCFGNFRFAFKELIQMNKEELEHKLSPYNRKISELEKEFKTRPSKMLEIEKIQKDKTWFLGYLSGGKVNREWEVSEKEGRTDEAFLRFRNHLREMSREIVNAQEKAQQNTDIYLTWDCMDIYFATSMRHRWEFEETHDFIEEVFSDNRLKKFKLRYFDPTQSVCKNPREKGLIEGLMLRRALCTIYLAQESDTMGKDSELAATLAQSKPVIAYVPEYDPEEYSKKIKDYPLYFFKRRLLILDAEDSFSGIQEDLKWNERLLKSDPNFEKTISDFLEEYEQYRCGQPYELYFEKENEFKKTSKFFEKICNILAIVECYSFEKRVELLNKRHPLSMQVDLQTGVANGVLVVRNPKECAELLFKILTNKMKFIIRKDSDGFVLLEEEITRSPYRVVIDDEKLTNSFWNLFFSH